MPKPVNRRDIFSKRCVKGIKANKRGARFAPRPQGLDFHLVNWMNTETERQKAVSPLMAQWQECKERAEGAILLFQLGDFYEAFHEDAQLVAKELGVTLTKRQEVPMSGVPLHAADSYIDQLIEKGYRVALAEQVEDPHTAKGLVKREVVRIVTPGAVVNSSLLKEKTNNYCAALTRVGALFGLASLDLTTGEFQAAEFEKQSDLLNEIYRLQPSELVISEKLRGQLAESFKELQASFRFLVTCEKEWRFSHQLAYETLTSHMKVQNLDGFGLKGKVAAVNASGALLAYVREVLMHKLDHVKALQTYCISDYLSLDYTSQRNLEILEPLNRENRKSTLLSVLDQTKTPMGARLMRRWLVHPLLSLTEITKRQDAVSELLSEDLSPLLEPIMDLERLMMKISASYASARDLLALNLSLEPLALLEKRLGPFGSALLQELKQEIQPLPELQELLQRAIAEDPPLKVGEGHVIKSGFDRELDDLRALRRDNQAWIACYQSHLREQYGIKTLKVGYNRVFGYYIEVSKGQSGKMPPSFHRKQTLAHAERFISPELKSYESKVLEAEEKILRLETELFQKVRESAASFAEPVHAIAKAVAKLDCLAAFAQAANKHGYCRPLLSTEERGLHILRGRHPIIEAMQTQEPFVPNDTQLDENERLAVITGPNMAGKSTYLRQVALIVLMAQIGSFVPASEARLNLVDQIFTRIGASDDLSRGLSTFMVEMTETAKILNHATERSLLILDEIGRGTSTYDGISIAWAVAEYLLTAHSSPPFTLFATHYFELTKLEEQVCGAVNYHVAAQEVDRTIVFLRKIVRGGADKSYGIDVARLAGLPCWVTARAEEILAHLEENGSGKTAFNPKKTSARPPAKKRREEESKQLRLF